LRLVLVRLGEIAGIVCTRASPVLVGRLSTSKPSPGDSPRLMVYPAPSRVRSCDPPFFGLLVNPLPACARLNQSIFSLSALSVLVFFERFKRFKLRVSEGQKAFFREDAPDRFSPRACSGLEYICIFFLSHCVFFTTGTVFFFAGLTPEFNAVFPTDISSSFSALQQLHGIFL